MAVSPITVNSIDKARARKLQALATNPAETQAAREGFRLRFDELASRLGLSPQALSAAL
jgi:DNA-binding transcriptional regulator YiaG